MKDKLDINIKIKDIVLPVTISPEEEPLLREVDKQVNHIFKEYTKMFPHATDIEILARVTLLFAKGFVAQSVEVDKVEQMLKDFDSDLDRLLIKAE